MARGWGCRPLSPPTPRPHAQGAAAAAAAGGATPAGGRGAREGADGKQQQHQHAAKLHTQLQKIENIMRTKGQFDEAAFAKPPPMEAASTPSRRGGGATPARGATGIDPGLSMGPKKKQRI